MREASLSLVVVTLATIALAGGTSLEANEISNVCSNSLNGTTEYVAHETDCTKYYKCSAGTKIIMQCPTYSPGQFLHFDPAVHDCNWPWETHCVSKSPDCSQNGYRESYPYDCSMYFECWNGAIAVERCARGQLFDSVQLACTPANDATCQTYTDKCPTGKLLVPVYLSHECSCNSYYECVDGEYIERWCPIGEGFDINVRTCVATEKAVCDPKSGNKPHPATDCPATGIKNIPHETDCSSYYECVDGVKYKKTCEDGLSFDWVKGMCLWPLSSECSSRFPDTFQLPAPLLLNAYEEIAPRRDEYKCPLEESNEIIRVPHHCSADKFYACEQGRMYLNTCPNGLVYDYVRQSCSDPNSAMSGNRQSGTIAKANYDYTGECPPNGRLLIAHETDCSLYYVCASGNRSSARSCLSGHYFNPVISSCDLPENTECYMSKPTVLPTTTEQMSPNWCSISDTKCRLYPDSCNCSVYSQCEGNRMVMKVCPGNLYFDDDLQTCNLAQNVVCAPDCGHECKEGELAPHECQCEKYYQCHNGRQYLEVCGTGMSFDSRAKRCVKSSENHHCYPDVPENDCIGTCPSTGIDYLPHEDCKKYCICDNGNTEVESCTGWSVYNPDEKKCDWPENVRNLKCDPFPCTAGTESTKVPHECECNMYYECVNSTKYREYCEEGEFYDYEKQTCVDTDPHCYRDREPDDAQNCKETCGLHDSASIMSHEDCTKYCKCTNGNRHIYTCPGGQYFDESRKICDWYENIEHLSCDPFDCGPKDKVEVPHECNCTIYYQCNGTDKIRSTCDDGLYYDYILQKCVKADPHCMRQYSEEKGAETDRCVGTCPRHDSASLVHLPHEDCSQYCICSFGRPYIVKCVGGLHYNKYEQICTSPRTAHCQTAKDTEKASVWSGFPFADTFNIE